MCARYELSVEDCEEIGKIIEDVSRKFSGTALKTGEIFPTERVPIVAKASEQTANTENTVAKWGFPKYDNKGVIFNARSETATEKNLFRDSFLYRRCVVPCSGFFEWTHSGTKQKYRFNLPETKALYLGGIVNIFGREHRFTVLTTAANPSMSAVHDRMPVIVTPDRIHDWIFDTDLAVKTMREIQPELVKIPV